MTDNMPIILRIAINGDMENCLYLLAHEATNTTSGGDMLKILYFSGIAPEFSDSNTGMYYISTTLNITSNSTVDSGTLRIRYIEPPTTAMMEGWDAKGDPISYTYTNDALNGNIILNDANTNGTLSTAKASGALTFNTSGALQIGKAHSSEGSKGTIKLSNSASSNQYYTTITPSATTTVTLTLPSSTGTLALTSQIPAAATSVTSVSTATATGTSTSYARADHVHSITVTTGDSNGQVKIAGTNVSVKGLGTAAYTASTAYATSGHTHTLTIAADSGTNAITLAHGTKYKLTAGGSTLIFTTPSDNNTDVNVRQQLYAQNYNLPLLMAYQTNTNTTTNVDNIAFRNNSIYANPSTGLVAATQYKVNEAVTLSYNSTTKSLDFIFA